MRTEEKVFFGIGTASFLLMLSDLLLEVFSASLFIGSKRLISYIGILIIVCAVSFTLKITEAVLKAKEHGFF